jgi:hypothetical protein
VGYAMFNLMKGLMGPDVTLKNLLSTARACNNLAYCATVIRIRDQHAAVHDHIQRANGIALLSFSGALWRHLLAPGSTLTLTNGIMTISNGRRRVVFSARGASAVRRAHAVHTFAYDSGTSVVANGRRLFGLISDLKQPEFQTNQTTLVPAVGLD